jgi:hypothetical protein
VQAGNLYATGSFTTAGGVVTHNLAVRTGTTWSEVGGGLATNGDALAATSGGGVVVTGAFSSTADSTHQLASVAVWTPGGQSWQSLGQGAQAFDGVVGPVNALATDGSGGVYAGGVFSQLGAVPANNIGHWTGKMWEPLSSGLALGTSPAGAAVFAMVVLDG